MLSTKYLFVDGRKYIMEGCLPPSLDFHPILFGAVLNNDDDILCMT